MCQLPRSLRSSRRPVRRRWPTPVPIALLRRRRQRRPLPSCGSVRVSRC